MDEKQFVEMFELLRRETNDFTEINEESLKENPQFLFIFRIILCLSQLEFANLLKIDKQWVRHFEAGRQGFKQSKILSRCIKLLQDSFSNNGILIEKSIEILRINQHARKKNIFKFPEPIHRFKRISEMTIIDLENNLKILKNLTKDFTIFSPTMLITNPDSFATFRIILNMNIHEFSKAVQQDSSNIRRWESFRDRIMPEKAEKIMSKIESLFRINNIFGNVNSNDVMKNFERLTLFEPEEIKIKDALLSNFIPFDVHANFRINSKLMNIDFLIPSSTSPKIAIEVTKISAKKRKEFIHRIVFIDHKFQMIKIANKTIKTIMVIECDKNRENLVKRIIDREVLNTDFCPVNSIGEISNLVKTIF